MTQPLQQNRWGKVGLGLVLAIALIPVITWFAGYLYLWRIKADPFSAGPLTIVRYWLYYPATHKTILVFSGIAAVVVWGSIIAALWPKARSLHGDARFAKYEEVKEAGLLKGKGIILGELRSGFLGLKRELIMLAGQLGVVLAAPPRSGKGAGFVNTNMMNWPDSVVLLDPRQESWRVTSGFRAKHGQRCYLWNPLAENGRTAQWNPLTYVSANPALRINDIQKIAYMFFPDPEKGDPFWTASSRTMFLGVCLYLFETPTLPTTLGEVLRQVMNASGLSSKEYWEAIIEKRGPRSGNANPLSHECAMALDIFLATPEKTLDNVVKTFTSKLELWLNPMVDAATSADSFDLRDLRKKLISIYVGVLPGDLKRLKVLLALFFQQMLDVNCREMPEDNPELKFQMLLMLDEATAPGVIPALADTVAFLGGYGIRVAIVIQSPAQLRGTYGPEVAETILTCMGAQIVFAPRSQKDAEDYSAYLGFETVKSKNKSKEKGLSSLGAKKGTGSESTSDQRRALLLPQEVKAIGRNRQIIFIEYELPILCHKLRYFKHPEFKKRVLTPFIQPAVQIVKRVTAAVAANAASGYDLMDTNNEAGAISWEKMEVADVPKLDKMELRDFGGSYDHIEIPKDPISDEEMTNVVDQFLQEFRRSGESV